MAKESTINTETSLLTQRQSAIFAQNYMGNASDENINLMENNAAEAQQTRALLGKIKKILKGIVYYTPHALIGILALLSNAVCNIGAGRTLGAPTPLPLLGGIGGTLGNWGINLAGWLDFLATGRFKIWEALIYGTSSDRIKVILIALCGIAAAASIYATSYNGIIDSQVNVWQWLGGEALNDQMAWFISILNFLTAIFSHIYYLHQIVIDWMRPDDQSSALRLLRRLTYKLSTRISAEGRKAILRLQPLAEQLQRSTVQGSELLETLNIKLAELQKMSESLDEQIAELAAEQTAEHDDDEFSADADGIIAEESETRCKPKGVLKALDQCVKNMMKDTISQEERKFAQKFYDYTQSLVLPEKNMLIAMLIISEGVQKESWFDYNIRHKMTSWITTAIGLTMVIPQCFGIWQTAKQVVEKLTGSAGAAVVAALVWSGFGDPAKIAMYVQTQKRIAEYLWHLWDIISWFFNGLSPKAKMAALGMFTGIIATVGFSGFCTTDTTKAFICAINELIDFMANQTFEACSNEYSAGAQAYIWYTFLAAVTVNTVATLRLMCSRTISAVEKKADNVGVSGGLSTFLGKELGDIASTFAGTPSGIYQANLLTAVHTLVNNPDDVDVQQDTFISLLDDIDKYHKNAAKKKPGLISFFSGNNNTNINNIELPEVGANRAKLNTTQEDDSEIRLEEITPLKSAAASGARRSGWGLFTHTQPKEQHSEEKMWDGLPCVIL